MEDKQDNITGVGATGIPTQNIGGQIGSPVFGTPQITQPNPSSPRHLSWMRGGVKLWVSVAIAFLLLTLGAVAYGVAGRAETDNASKNSLLDQTDKYDSQKIDLGDISVLDSINLSTSQSLSVNGQLRANNSLVLAPTARPTQGTAGQLYYDQALNGLAYYNGSDFVSIAGDEDIASLRTQILEVQASIPTIPTIPTVPSDIATFSGQNIFQALNTFNGGVNASNLEVTGNTTLQGGLSVSGNTTLGPTTMSSLLLTTSLGVGSGGTGTNTLTNNGVLLGQGTNPIASVTASGPNLCLMSTAGAPAFAACPGGGGSGVDLLNGLAGTLTIANATGAGATITINDATSGAKGIASFNSTNFSVASGAVNTVQDISVTSSPTFNALSLTTALSVASGGTGANTLPNNSVIIGQGAGSLTGVTAGAPSLCLISTAGAPSFQTCPGSGGVVSVNGLAGTLTVNNSTGAGSTITINDASTASKGIASFNATNFLVSGGAVNVVQNINTAATPTFAGLTVNGTVNGQTISSTANFTGSLAVVGALNANTITPTGAMTVGATSQSLVLQGNATTSLRATSAGITNSLVFATPAGSNKNITLPNASGTIAVSASGPLALDANGNISCPTCATTGGPAVVDSLNGLTGALILANATGAGSIVTIDDASTTAKGIASFNGTNFTASNGAINTVQNINTTATPTFGGLTVNGSLNTNTITPTGAMTIGATGQSLTLQGNASTTLSATNGANTTSLAFQSPTANVSYRLQTAAAGTYDVCTTVGNCSGVGGGVTTPGGTVGAIAKFSAAQTLVDSLLSESGSVVTVGGSLSVNTISPTGAMTIGSTSQDLILQGDDSTRLSATLGGITNSLLFSAPSGSNKTITLPNASGTVAVSASGPISIDANGNISCPTCTTSGGGGGGAVDSLNGLNGTLTVANATGAGSTITIDNASTTAKGIASFNSTNFSVTNGAVNTIQDISVSSSPTFNALTLSTALSVSSGGTGATTASGARTNLGAAASGANNDIISLSGLTTALSIGQGGTGATTSQAALNNISQLTTNGDLLYHNGTNSTRLARGVNGECLTSNAITVLWSACGLTAEADTLATVTGRGATTATAVLLQGGATVRGMTIDTATATDDKIALGVTTGGAASFTGTLTVADLTAARTWTLSDESGTICLQNSTSCGFALTAGSTAYIQNQNASQQATANFWMSGTGRADTALQAPTFDTATATTLTLGGNATSISVLDDATLAAGKSLTVTGGTTGTRPASPTEGMIYYDTTTDKLLIYSNGKWQADRSEAIIVAASNSSQADKDAADYVGDGNTGAAADGDQVQINQALTAASGKKVVLLAGTYVADATILIPNNTTLAGVGRGTLIELADIDAGDNLIENSDTGTGTGIAIQDLRVDGRKDLNTVGAQEGVYLNGMGAGTGSTARQGAKVTNVIANNFRESGIKLNNSTNNTLTGNTAQGNTYGINLFSSSSNNTLTGNTAQGNSSYGIYLFSSSNNTLTGNTTQGNGYGFLLSSSDSNTLTGNSAQGDTAIGFQIDSSKNILTGNTAQGSTRGVRLGSPGSNNTLTGNSLLSNSLYGLLLDGSAGNTVSGNKFHDNGGATTNNSIYGWSADSNTITGNNFTDTSATSNNYAINIDNAGSDANYLAGNTLGTGSINNVGTGTIFGGQVNNSGNYLIQPAGTVELMKNTNVTGALAVTGNATVSGGTLTVGTAAVAGSVVINDGSSHTATIQVGNLAGNYVYTIPVTTANDSFCLQTLANCSGGGASTVGALDGGTANADGATISGTTIYLQSASSSFAGFVNTTTQTFAGDKTFVGDLSVQNVSLAANKSITITGGATGTRPGSPTEGMVYYDSTTKQLLTYTNGKWQADRSASTKIVAASNSTQAAKDAADYVADGTGDEVEINAALTAATGGKVYLMEGTYTAAATILVPNDTVLSGAGRGTLIRLADIDASDNLIENASAQPRVTIRDLRIDGQKTLNTAGTQDGIYLNGGAGNVGPVIENVEIANFRTRGIYSRIAYTSITNVTSESNTDKGFLLDTGTHQKLEGITARSNGQQGIWIDSGADLTTVTDSKFISNSDRGVRIIAAGVKFTNNTVTSQSSNNGIEIATDRTTVTGNTVTGNQTGIVVTGNNNTITDNGVSSNTGTGIVVSTSTNTTISSNYIGSNGSIGISVGNIVGVTITSNTINGNADYGIQLDLTDQALVANNYISNNGGAGGFSSIRIYSGCCGAPDENRIIDNVITDTAGTGFAILISNGSRNYLSGNTYSGTGATSISDSGTGTIYANQLDSNGHLINRGTAAMSVNTATVTSSLTLQGGLTNTQLPVPALPVIGRVGTAGTTTYGYKVTALDGTGETLPSTEGTIATANATLTGANYNTITWVSVPGAVQYKIYRTTSGGTPASTGLIGTVTGSATSVFNDTGIAATTAAPAANTTGGASIAGAIQGASATLSGALTVQTATATDDQLLVSITGGGAARFTGTVTSADLTANRVWTLPDESGTICLQGSANCGFLVGAASSFIQNQNASQQATSDFWMSGTGRADTALQAPVFDTATATALTLGGTATSISVLDNVTMAAGTSLTVTGGVTGTRPGSPTEGMIYFDTTTKQLLTYANGKWQADRSSSTKIVAMGTTTGCSGSAPAASQNFDGADYVVASCTSAQTTINTAITALGAAGGTIYLMEGTYIIDGPINMNSNITLAGSGVGTVLKFKDSTVTNTYGISTSSDTNMTLRDFKIDGNKANNAGMAHRGLDIVNTGTGSGATTVSGISIENVRLMNMSGIGAYFNGTRNSTISNTTSIGNTGVGISFSSALNITMSDSTISGNGGHGINQPAEVTIADSLIEGNSGYGIEGVGASNSTVTGNTIRSNGSNGLNYNGSSSSNITGNRIVSNGGEGIFLTGANSVISGNVIGSNTSNGINVGTERVSITGNTVYSNGGTGIHYSGNYGTITGNAVNLNAGTGISLGNVVNYNIVSNNTIRDNGGSGGNSGITIGVLSANNSITDNTITDTAGTGYAISIDSTASTNTLSNNTYSGTGTSTINDGSANTIYVNQRDASGNVLNRGGAAMTINTTTVNSSLTLQGGLSNIQLSTPAQPTSVTNVGTAGSTTYGYKVTALDGTGETLPSTERTTTTGNATLTGVNYNTITWTKVPSAVQYKIYRTTSGGTPASTGLIGTVTGNATVTFNDTGIAATTAAPAANTTGGASIAGAIQGASATLSGALTVQTSTATDDQLLVSITGGGAARFTGTVTSADLTANRVWTLPDESGTICLQASANCGFLVGAASSFIQNQNAGQQATSNFWMSGTGRADTALQAPIFDTATATALTLGGTATSISVVDNVTLAAGISLTVTGGNTASRPGSPTEGMVYYDTTTKQLLTYANGKWQADRTDSTKIVGTSAVGGTSGAVASAAPDSADYVNASTTSAQTVINSAISALPATGGTVYLMEGTYIVDGAITAPSNVTITGAGVSTVLKLKNAINAGINLINANSGSNKVISNLKLDGNSANNTSGTQRAVDYGGVGSSTTPGVTMDRLDIQNFRSEALYGVTGWHTKLTNSYIAANSGEGVHLNGITNAEVSDNVFRGNTGTNIASYGARANIVNNKLTGGARVVVDGDESVVANNIIQSSTDQGMSIAGDKVAITGNTILGSGSHGIFLATSTTHVLISGNVISDSGQHGIFVYNGANKNAISSNFISSSGTVDAPRSGITIESGSSNNSITGNQITDTAGSGYAIYINGASNTNNYLADNTYSGTGASSINDTGTNTIFANQRDSNGNLINRGTAALSVNTTTVTSSLTLQGGLTNTQLPVPALPIIGRVGTAGTTTYGYKVTALDGTGETLPSTEGTIATANATLTGANYNTITWAPVPGAVQYKIYRTTSGGTPASLGLIGTVTGSATSVFNDTGIAATTAAPAANTTGGATIAGMIQGASATLNGALTVQTSTATDDQLFVSITGGGAARFTGTVTSADLTANRVWTLPDESGTICLQGSANCGFLVGAASSFIQNQNASQQATSNFWMSGTGRADTAFQAPIFDTATATTLYLGGNATSISVFDDTTLAAGKSLTVTGGVTGTRPGSPTEGMIYFDTTTKQLLTYANGKWQADRTDSVIVAASNSTDAEKGAADYVADGNTGAAADGDQVQINSALTAASGKKVVLLAGTYTVDASISIPNNTTLEGVSKGTVITIPNSFNASINVITNTTTNNTGGGVTIRNLKLDGNRTNQSSGTIRGIYMNGLGDSTSGIEAFNINNVYSASFRDDGIYVNSSNYGFISESATYDNNNYGIFVNGVRNNVVNNSSHDNVDGIVTSGALYSVVSNNKVQNNSSRGVALIGNSSDSSVTNNSFRSNGGSTTNNSLVITTSDSNSIFGNAFSDANCSTTCYAISITDSASDSNLISANSLGGNGTINDVGTGTIYGGQSNGTSYLIQPVDDFAITGTAASTISTAAGNLTLQAGSGTVSFGSSTALTASGTLAIRSGGATAMVVDTGGAAALSLGVTNANAVTISKTGTLTTIAGTLTVGEAATFSGTVTINGHIISGGSTPTIAAGTAACTTPTVAMAGTDTAGTITVTTGTGCSPTGKLATITFAAAYGSAPRVVLTSATSLTAGLNTYIDDSTISTTAFDLGTNTTPANSTTYKWYYHVIQ